MDTTALQNKILQCLDLSFKVEELERTNYKLKAEVQLLRNIISELNTLILNPIGPKTKFNGFEIKPKEPISVIEEREIS